MVFVLDKIKNYGKPIIIQMAEFQPNYNKCIDIRKTVDWNICKHIKKDTIIYCTLNNKECIAWKGYKHEN